MPIDHAKLPVADLDASRAFSSAAPLVHRLVWDEEPTLGDGTPGGPYGRCYYAAFVLDPDQHNIEAVCHRRPA